jgi:hypothetical protein
VAGAPAPLAVRIRGPDAARRTETRLAVAGLLLIGGCAAWLTGTAARSGGDAAPTVGIVVAVAASLVAAQALAVRHAWLAPGLVVAGAAALAAVRHDTLLLWPLGNPFGYSNAVGGFYMVASAAAVLVAARVGDRRIRAAALLLAAAAALVPMANLTATASVLVCLVPLGLLARTRRAARLCVGAGAAAFAGTLLVAIALGAAYQAGPRDGVLDRAVDATLSERRPELWHDALSMLAREPLAGVGPGRFPLESPTTRKDPDAHAPHNEALHFAAEAGVPGLLFLIGFFAWGFARLWWGAGDAGTAVAALALGAVGVHSNVDYVLHFPAIGIAAAALVAAGARLPAAAADGAAEPPEFPDGAVLSTQTLE